MSFRQPCFAIFMNVAHRMEERHHRSFQFVTISIDISEWIPGADDVREKLGDKPPKKKKEKKAKKGKHDRANPDFEDIPGYEGAAFKGSST